MVDQDGEDWGQHLHTVEQRKKKIELKSFNDKPSPRGKEESKAKTKANKSKLKKK